ncbi:MAG: hypothetical protein ACI8QC_002256 [Planctomycetota bacterium]|jgi:hypothetical protein
MALHRLDLTLLRKASARGFSSGLEIEGQALVNRGDISQWTKSGVSPRGKQRSPTAARS